MAAFELVVAPHAKSLYLHSRCGHTAWMTGDEVRRAACWHCATQSTSVDEWEPLYRQVTR